MNTDRNENFSVLPLLGVGALLLLLASGLLSGCQRAEVDVSLATKHIAPGETSWTFEAWGTKAGQSVNLSVSSDVDWLTVNPETGTSTGPSDRVLVTVTVDPAVTAGSAGVITVRAQLSVKTIEVTTAANYFTASYTNGIPLGDMALVFSPTSDLSGFSEEVLSVMSFLTDPANGSVLDLCGSCVKVDLSNGMTIPFYGETYSSVYVNGNGRLSFGGCESANDTLGDHFGTAGITGLSTANACDGGTVSVKQTADRLAVTFEDVPSGDVEGSMNNFQMELFFNGTIRLTYLDLDASESIVGLSGGGGLPDDFVESELTEDYNTGSLKSE